MLSLSNAENAVLSVICYICNNTLQSSGLTNLLSGRRYICNNESFDRFRSIAKVGHSHYILYYWPTKYPKAFIYVITLYYKCCHYICNYALASYGISARIIDRTIISYTNR
uniref:Uncharacterized protein n=1 Tax=Picea glauca TaxID=3330 RepID=A0A117NHL1_PICGL|nr:hypothetical protein ABT39_MTgene4573 [Picea glauca]QHR91968.1 hypothetical protein Q903MT_gene6004 [Picea sitchensis]